MNLSNLLFAIPNRIPVPKECKRPLIRTYNESLDLGINFDDLFTDKRYTLSDINTLASIWENLLPDNDYSCLRDKQMEIAEWLGGARNRNDLFILMKWLNKRCDVDSALIYAEIELSDE